MAVRTRGIRSSKAMLWTRVALVTGRAQTTTGTKTVGACTRESDPPVRRPGEREREGATSAAEAPSKARA